MRPLDTNQLMTWLEDVFLSIEWKGNLFTEGIQGGTRRTVTAILA